MLQLREEAVGGEEEQEGEKKTHLISEFREEQGEGEEI